MTEQEELKLLKEKREKTKHRLKIISIFALCAVIIGIPIYFRATPSGRKVWNEWKYSLRKADEQTYQNKQEVEDTCRAMIASYNQDKLIYEQYKNSNVDEEKSWANNAKIRANNTASTYNNYILKNNYVWKDNVPNDIYMVLEYIQ